MKTHHMLIAAFSSLGFLALGSAPASAAGPSFATRILQACTQGTFASVDSEVADQVTEACGGKKGDKVACEVVSPDPHICQALTPQDAGERDCGSGSVTIEVDLSVGLPAGFSASGKVKANATSSMKLKERKTCEEGPLLNATGGGTYVDESGLVAYTFKFTLHGSATFTHATLGEIKVEAGVTCEHSADVPFQKDKSNSCEISVPTTCVDDPAECDQTCIEDPSRCEPGVVEEPHGPITGDEDTDGYDEPHVVEATP